jgi:hypothetical protein
MRSGRGSYSRSVASSMTCRWISVVNVWIARVSSVFA